jgi:hypothetical protein
VWYFFVFLDFGTVTTVCYFFVFLDFGTVTTVCYFFVFLNFRTVTTVWYFFVFRLIVHVLNFLMELIIELNAQIFKQIVLECSIKNILNTTFELKLSLF